MTVAAYHYWGPDAVHRLRGMFAFVIWDRQQRRAFAARDPYGIKPLHYLLTRDGVYLASEKKALLPFAASRTSLPAEAPVTPDPTMRPAAHIEATSTYLSASVLMRYGPSSTTAGTCRTVTWSTGSTQPMTATGMPVVGFLVQRDRYGRCCLLRLGRSQMCTMKVNLTTVVVKDSLAA